jgi:hypothetical protein
MTVATICWTAATDRGAACRRFALSLFAEFSNSRELLKTPVLA